MAKTFQRRRVSTRFASRLKAAREHPKDLVCFQSSIKKEFTEKELIGKLRVCP